MPPPDQIFELIKDHLQHPTTARELARLLPGLAEGHELARPLAGDVVHHHAVQVGIGQHQEGADTGGQPAPVVQGCRARRSRSGGEERRDQGEGGDGAHSFSY